MAEERLQKVLARAGVASRRKAEALIAAGRVRVNGEVVRQLGTKVDPHRDRIEVDGRPVRLPRRHTYLLLHKPMGVVTTLRDPQGRPTVADLIRGVEARVFPVGRLDQDTEGLLLLTDDGELAYRLTHPRYGVEKVYHALVRGRPSAATLERWRRGGIVVEGRPSAPAQVRVLRTVREGTWLEIVLHEGRKRQVRRVAAALGHPVLYLKRVRLGPLTLGRLPRGRWRPLSRREVRALRRAVGLR